jgi:hypothetical protein
MVNDFTKLQHKVMSVYVLIIIWISRICSHKTGLTWNWTKSRSFLFVHTGIPACFRHVSCILHVWTRAGHSSSYGSELSGSARTKPQNIKKYIVYNFNPTLWQGVFKINIHYALLINHLPLESSCRSVRRTEIDRHYRTWTRPCKAVCNNETAWT